MPYFLVDVGGQQLQVDCPATGLVHVGSDVDCDVCIHDAEVASLHAIVDAIGGGAYRLRSASGDSDLSVNGIPVVDAVALKDGDVIEIGRARMAFHSSKSEIEGAQSQRLASRAEGYGMTSGGVVSETTPAGDSVTGRGGAPTWMRAIDLLLGIVSATLALVVVANVVNAWSFGQAKSRGPEGSLLRKTDDYHNRLGLTTCLVTAAACGLASYVAWWLVKRLRRSKRWSGSVRET